MPATMPHSAPISDRAGAVGAGKAAGRADDHHALDAEIEHAGALGDEFAGRREQQRRRCRDAPTRTMASSSSIGRP